MCGGWLACWDQCHVSKDELVDNVSVWLLLRRVSRHQEMPSLVAVWVVGVLCVRVVSGSWWCVNHVGAYRSIIYFAREEFYSTVCVCMTPRLRLMSLHCLELDILLQCVVYNETDLIPLKGRISRGREKLHAKRSGRLMQSCAMNGLTDHNFMLRHQQSLKQTTRFCILFWVILDISSCK